MSADMNCEDCAGDDVKATLTRWGAEYECQDCGSIFFDTDQEGDE